MLQISIFLASIVLVFGAERCCYDTNVVPKEIGCYHNTYPFDNMPLPDCPDFIQVSMRVYTRLNPDEGRTITKTTVPSIWKSGKKTHFVVHGWLGSHHAFYLHNMKDAALDAEDMNVILVGWSGGSRQVWYPQSASDTRVVGTEIALVAQNLVDNYGLTWDQVVCAGHSLGGHVCGHAGKRAQRGTWGRITGLDPAGPWFENKDHPDVGLDPSDADLVDVLHTHGERGVVLNLGTLKPLGHMDFYPNGGGTQIGCIIDTYDYLGQPEVPVDESDLVDELNIPDKRIDLTPFCSHLRALIYYRESLRGDLTNCRYLAYHTCTDPYNIPASCTRHAEPQGAMGYFANTFQDHGLFYLETNKKKPFCQE